MVALLPVAMSSEAISPGNQSLGDFEKMLIELFVLSHSADPSITGPELSDMDKISGGLADVIASYRIDLSNQRDYFGVMVGLSLGATGMKELIDLGLTSDEAIAIVQAELAYLYHET